jgi:hypothetical protein
MSGVFLGPVGLVAGAASGAFILRTTSKNEERRNDMLVQRRREFLLLGGSAEVSKSRRPRRNCYPTASTVKLRHTRITLRATSKQKKVSLNLSYYFQH